jgi:glucose-6-phosphate isomerase
MKSTDSAIQGWASLGSYLPSVRNQIERLRDQGFAERFWAKDASLWSDDPQVEGAIRNRLGWMSVLPDMQKDCALLRSFADEVRRAGFTHALLLGMGGSSLCAEVCSRTFGVRRGFLDLAVLDSTDPAAVRRAERRAPLNKTLFIVATKSGTTTETLSFYRYFFERVRRRAGDRAGEQFVAITDPETPLVALADESGFRRTFLNPPDIGGRYSALSYFGLLPAALLGIDMGALLDRAEALLSAKNASLKTEQHPAILLGIALAELGRQGRDKVTFQLAPEIAAFGCWAEQLIAESTGKQGKGLIPVDGEPLGHPRAYGDDRVFIHMRMKGSADAAAVRRLEALQRAGHPVIRIELADRRDIGKEFFRWEIATAVTAAIWKINAFDEPNVKESKDNTERLLKRFSTGKDGGNEKAAARSSGLRLFGASPSVAGRKAAPTNRGSVGNLIRDLLMTHLRKASDGDYVALLAYLSPSRRLDQTFAQLRRRLRDGLRVATTVGYGPRYLHSTGQLHKGGPANGVFVEFTADDAFDLEIPGLPYGFSVLKQAQARGDQEALESRARWFLRVHINGSAENGLRQILRWVESGLRPPKDKSRGRRKR